MRRTNYNPEDEASAVKWASHFLSAQLQNLAPGVFEHYRQILTKNSLPSMAQMEYPCPYNAFDFASFITFTMYNFHNLPHCDSDANTWTMVCWIPIFSPKTASEGNPILADKGFNMLGGQFTFCKNQVYLDLKAHLGVTICVFRSTDYVHQTLPGVSPSGKYTRLGFSCQMSTRMTKAVVDYLSGKKPNTIVAGQKVQIANAMKPPKKRG